jgi:hypothetical protein
MLKTRALSLERSTFRSRASSARRRSEGNDAITPEAESVHACAAASGAVATPAALDPQEASAPAVDLATPRDPAQPWRPGARRWAALQRTDRDRTARLSQALEQNQIATQLGSEATWHAKHWQNIGPAVLPNGAAHGSRQLPLQAAAASGADGLLKQAWLQARWIRPCISSSS